MAVEANAQLKGAKILEIFLRTDDDTSVYRGEYCNYELLVVTDKGVLKFAGCHDIVGDIEIETSEEMIAKYYRPAPH